MAHYLDIIIRSIFLENLPLSFFLGMCTFLAISKQVKTAIGLGVAVLFIQVITVPINNLILTYLLKPGALAWAGHPDLDLSFLGLLTYIAIIAAVVARSWMKSAREAGSFSINTDAGRVVRSVRRSGGRCGISSNILTFQ